MRACPNTTGFGRRPARTCRTKRTGSNRRGDAGCVVIASIKLHLAGGEGQSCLRCMLL